MQVNTGELRSVAGEEQMEKLLDQGFEPVPDELNHAAKRKLVSKDRAMVSLTSGGKLSRWAAGKRKKARSKAKAVRRSGRHYGGR